jgi:RNA polymerase sigma-70 factor, ECF subfamily
VTAAATSIRHLGPCAGLCTSDGLAELDRAHYAVLLRRARFLLEDPGLAEEAVQEVFVRAWRACAGFDPAGEPVRHWLLVVLRNVAIDLSRAKARRPRLLAAVPDERPWHAAVPDAGVDALVLRACLIDALARITVAHRTAILATIVRDRTYDEAAVELDVPVGTVKSRVFYGLRRLRELVEQPAAA